MKNKILEFSIINDFFKPLAGSCLESQGLDDDVAKISVNKDEEIIISKDIAVEDIHFSLKDGGYKIASKLMLSNLSDIASAGAKPLYYMLGFTKNKNTNSKFLQDFCMALQEIQDRFNIRLIGGDTSSSSEKLFFSVTIFGSVKKNKNLLRKNAKEGDLIFTSGTIGDAHLGLLLSQEKINKNFFTKKQYDYFLSRHFFPNARIELGLELAKRNISSCATDISDGFFADLKNICISSKLSAFIDYEKIPFTIKKIPDNTSYIDFLSAGDDYELIFSAKKNKRNAIAKLSQELNLKITEVGYFAKTKSTSDVILTKNNKKIKIYKYGYQH